MKLISVFYLLFFSVTIAEKKIFHSWKSSFPIEAYTGIRYAKAPVDDLRFKVRTFGRNT